MASRRSFILGAAGAALVLVGGASVWRVTRQPGTAALPWALDPSPPADVRLDALRHAILAPNPHNRQPWLMRLEGEDAVLLTCDLDRRLPETDPFDRQITVGFGCFVEIAALAAAERGYRMDVEPFPEGEPAPRLDDRPVARLRFAADPALGRDPLFAAVLRRRSNKEPYDLSRPVEGPALAQVASAAGADVSVGWTADSGEVSAIRDVVVEALATEIDLPRTYLESARLIRIGHREVDASPDGIDLSGPMIEGLQAAGMIDHAQLADPSSTAFRSGRDAQLSTYGSAPAFIHLSTKDNARRTQFAAGRAYARVNLAATAAGLSMHPMSQGLQEFPEMDSAFRRMHALLGASGQTRVQMLARVGYGPQVSPSPRWPLETRMIEA